MLLNCGVGEDNLESSWTARRSNQSTLKEISPEYSLEGLMWSWNCNTLATWCENPTHWKRPWCWDRLKLGGEGDDRGWDGWMATPTRWTWVWAGSGCWWWIGKSGVLQSMGSQEVWHDWVNWTELNKQESILGDSVVKNPHANAGDTRDIGSIPGEGNGNPLQYSCLGNPMDRGACSPWGGKEWDTTEQLNNNSN